MVTHKIVPPHPPFDYGSSVRVSVTPNPYGFDRGSVFGFRVIDDLELAEKRAVPVGTLYVLVENELGVAFEILAKDLETL